MIQTTYAVLQVYNKPKEKSNIVEPPRAEEWTKLDRLSGFEALMTHFSGKGRTHACTVTKIQKPHGVLSEPIQLFACIL